MPIFATPEQAYLFPVQEPNKATFLSVVSELIVDNSFKRSIEYIEIDNIDSKREELPWLGDRMKADVGFSYHPNQKRPLIFVLGGLGATEISGTNLFYQQVLYSQGFHVMSVASPFHWSFNMSQFPTATPGYSRLDRHQLYRVMKEAFEKASKDHSFEVSEFYLLGYSMGGLQSIFVAEWDQQEKYFDFQKVLAVNPPVDLYESASRLDSMFPFWTKRSEAYQSRLQSKVFAYVRLLNDRYGKDGFTENVLLEEIEKLPFRQKDYKALIAKTFLETLSGTVLSSELVNDRGSFPMNRNHYSPQPAIIESEKWNFVSYFEKILLPELYKRNWLYKETKEQIIKDMGLYSLEKFLKENQQIHFFHNSDDIIISQDSLRYLRSVVGEERLKLYPRGGHLGNVWWPKNVQDLVLYFKN